MRFSKPLLIFLSAVLWAADATAQDTAGTVRSHPGAIEISKWHERRLAIHRVTAYTIPPLFAAQYLVGQHLYAALRDPEGPGPWVRPTHRAGAYLIATAFAVNATTGALNLWAARHEEEGRAMRIVHGTSMLIAAGGFAYAGARLAPEAETSAQKRRQHRNVAAASMGLTLISGTLMWLGNR